MLKIKPIHYKKLAKIFEFDGFIYRGCEGDHLIYTKSGISRPVIIPKYKEIPVFIIKNNLRTAGISRKKYFELLNKI